MIILKKALGNINVKKLRAILLLEIDFNALYKIIFNGKIIPTLEERNNMSHEIIGSRGTQAAIYLVLNKKLIANIANIRKVPTIIICADSLN